MQRLQTRQQFQAVLAGQTLARTPHFALHRTHLPAPELALGARPLFDHQAVWLGVMVPKRWAKRAVTRNAIKRQVYAVSAGFETALASAAHVVRLRSSFDRVQFVSASSDVLKRAVRSELMQLFAKAVELPAPLSATAA